MVDNLIKQLKTAWPSLLGTAIVSVIISVVIFSSVLGGYVSLSKYNKDVDGLKATIKANQDATSQLSTTQNALVAQVNSMQSTMQGSITNLQNSLNTTNGSISNYDKKVSSVQSSEQKDAGDITTLQSTVNGINGSVAGLQSTITTQSASLNTLNSQVSSLNSQVSSLGSSVSNLNSKLTGSSGSLSFSPATYPVTVTVPAGSASAAATGETAVPFALTNSSSTFVTSVTFYMTVSPVGGSPFNSGITQVGLNVVTGSTTTGIGWMTPAASGSYYDTYTVVVPIDSYAGTTASFDVDIYLQNIAAVSYPVNLNLTSTIDTINY